MSVTIDGIVFDRARYDADADVLYLHVGDPDAAVDFDETREGHAVRFDADGRIVGLTGPIRMHSRRNRRVLAFQSQVEPVAPINDPNYPPADEQCVQRR